MVKMKNPKTTMHLRILNDNYYIVFLSKTNGS